MRRQRHLALLVLSFVLLLFMPLPAAAAGPEPAALPAVEPQDALTQAWQLAREAGSYRFASTSDQSMIPRAVPEMVGQTNVNLTIENDGAVLLPDRAYMKLRVAGLAQEASATLLRDGSQAYMLQDNELKPVEDALSLAPPTSDVLGYLAGAEHVTLLDPPAEHPELTRYGFTVNGERLEAHIREQTLRDLAEEPGAPEGLSLQPSHTLQTIAGRGELWVNQAGYPVRQVLDIEIPEASEYYRATLHMVVDLSGFGQVEALPRAVQNTDGTWRLDGKVTMRSASSA